MSKISVSFI